MSDLAVLELLDGLGVVVHRQQADEIQCFCPVHRDEVGHEDNSPSFYINADTGLWKCFSCGAGGTLPILVSRLGGDTTTVRDVMRQAVINKTKRIVEKRDPDEPVRCDERTYNRFSDPPAIELHERGITRRSVDHYGVRWNDDRHSWILPIRDQQGKLMGWQEKAGKWVRNWPVGVEKGHTVFGGHLTKSKERLIVVESPLDCCRIWTAGHDGAVATFGSAVTAEQIKILRGGKPLVIAMDNDDAGQVSKLKIREAIPRAHIFNYTGSGAKDPGDMTDEQIDRALQQAHTPMSRLRRRLAG